MAPSRAPTTATAEMPFSSISAMASSAGVSGRTCGGGRAGGQAGRRRQAGRGKGGVQTEVGRGAGIDGRGGRGGSEGARRRRSVLVAGKYELPPLKYLVYPPPHTHAHAHHHHQPRLTHCTHRDHAALDKADLGNGRVRQRAHLTDVVVEVPAAWGQRGCSAGVWGEWVQCSRITRVQPSPPLPSAHLHRPLHRPCPTTACPPSLDHVALADDVAEVPARVKQRQAVHHLPAAGAAKHDTPVCSVAFWGRGGER